MARDEFPLHLCANPQQVSFPDGIAQTWPGTRMSWSNPGNITVQGTTWKSDASLNMSGDPTSHLNAVIKLNTGANHDCNALWSCPKDYAATNLVRGLYFKNYTNQAKFRPRITGVALQYKKPSGTTKYFGLGYRGTYYNEGKGGNLSYEGGSSSNYFWATGKKGTTDGNVWDSTDAYLSGVLFHFETTWKSGSAVDCVVWVNSLRFITQANVQHSNIYHNTKYRMWGVKMK